jgi:hypothetical protein
VAALGAGRLPAENTAGSFDTEGMRPGSVPCPYSP